MRALAFLVFAACSTTTTIQPPTYDVGGSWSGSFVSQTGARGTTTASLTQTGSNLGGSFTADNSCIGGGKFTGTLSADSLSGSVSAGAVTISLSGTVASAKQIDGTYTLGAGGACPADSGSFHLAR
jgi:hypothetical protein